MLLSRKDGEETRKKILDAASQVFGEKGYRSATNAAICKLAGANIAAINYHFGSKADLYREAMKHAVEKAHSLYPLDGGLPDNASSEVRLKAAIHALLSRFSDEKNLSHLHRIRMTEHFSSTGLLDDIMKQFIKKTTGYLYAILRELLGPKATDRDISLCEMSIMSQCLMRPDRKKKMPPPIRKKMERIGNDVNLLSEHMWRFSLAGIMAVKKEIESRN